MPTRTPTCQASNNDTSSSFPPAGNSNPDSAPDGVNATATAGNKVVTLEIKRPTWSGYQTKGGTTIQMRDKVGISMSLGTHKNEAYISATEP